MGVRIISEFHYIFLVFMESFSYCVAFNVLIDHQDVGSKITTMNCTPFGGGIRLCPGAELSKMAMAIFLHLAVTKYR